MFRFRQSFLLLNNVNGFLKRNNTINPFAASLSTNIDNQLLEILSPTNVKSKTIEKRPTFEYNSCMTLDSLKQELYAKRPRNDIEVTKFLVEFDKLLKHGNNLETMDFFVDNKIETAIEAHILGGESSIHRIFQTTVIVSNLFGINYGKFGNLNKCGKHFKLLNDLLNKCHQAIKNKSFAELPIESINSLYFILNKYDGNFINADFMKVLREKVMLYVNDTTSIKLIIGVLKNGDLTPIECRAVFEKASELLPNLSAIEAISLMYSISFTKQRPLSLLRQIVQHIEFKNDNSMELNDLFKLAQALEILSFHDIQALRIICKNFVKNINTFNKPNKVLGILSPLSIMNCGNKDVWGLVENWLNNNYKDIDVFYLIKIVTILSKINCSPKAIEIPLNYFRYLVTIKNGINSNTWLRYVYGMTILDKLTPRMTESVLRKEFIKDLLTSKNKDMKFFLLNMIAQIDCAAGIELVDFKGPKFSLDHYIDTNTNLTNRISNMLYDIRARNFVEAADTAIKRILGSEKMYSGPRVFKNGILINNIIGFTKENEIRIIDDWETFIEGDNLKIAILYISNKQMIKDVDTDVCIRENGTVALKIRLLEKVGFKVVNIYEHEFAKNCTALENVNYVKQEIGKYLKL